MPGIKYRISLEGGEQVNKELLSVEQAVKRLQDAAKTGVGADTFASTTTAISSLGKTADEAFTNAAAAAKKFGASTAELARADGVIKALAARSRDSSTSFATLAENYDKARGSLGAGGAAATAASIGLGKAAVAATETAVATRQLNTALGLTRTQIGTMAQVASAAGAGPLARMASVVGGAATGLGGLAAAVAGVAVAGGTLFTFAKGAAESAKALKQLSQVSGQSFDSLSGLQEAFGQLGVSAETFQKTFSNLFQQLSAQAPQLAFAFVGAADKATGAVNNFKQAQLSLMRAEITDQLARGYISAAEAAQRLEGIQRGVNRLAVESAAINARNAERGVQSALANNLQDIVALMKQAVASGRELKFDALTEAATKAEALKIRLLQVQIAGGSVAEEMFKILRAMSAVDAANVGAKLGLPPEMITAIRDATVNVEDLARTLRASGQILSEIDSAPLLELDRAINLVSAAWRNFTQLLGIKTAPFFADLLNQLTQFGLKAITLFEEVGSAWDSLATKFRENIAPKAQPGMEAIRDQIADLNKGAAVLSTSILQFFGASEETIKRIAADMQGLAPEAAKTGAAVGQGIEGGLKKGATAADELKRKLKAIEAPTIKPVPDVFAAASKGADQFKAQLRTVERGIEAAIWNKAAFGGGIEAQIWSGGAGGAGPAGIRTVPDAQPAQQSMQQIVTAAGDAAEKVKQIFSDIGSSIVIDVDFSGVIAAAETAAQQIASSFSAIDISSALGAQIDSLITKLGQLASAASAATTAITDAASGGGGGSGGGGSIPEEARGGLFGGRGTGTSDSNLAWVSRGEHIMPARAVRQPGVLAFLEALRRSGGDLSRILDGMGRFALGGMVPRTLPAFANGGPVGGMSNVTIQFPGVPPIGGLRASSEVVDQLHKAAALAQVRSGGRKPSRYS